MKNKIIPIGIGFAIVVAITALAVAVSPIAQKGVTLQGISQASLPQGYITVTASGIVKARPTGAQLGIAVNATGNTVAESVSALSASLSRLNSTLSSYVANMSDIETTSYYTYKTYNRSTYTAVETISIFLEDNSRLSPLLGDLSAFNGTYVTSVASELSTGQISALRAAALQAALANATSQAEALVAPLQVRLRNITVNSYFIRPYIVNGGAAADSSAQQNQAVPAYFPGRGEVSESITAMFSYG